MHPPALDDRLSRAAALFPACEYGADIGADHGRLSCALLARGICQRMCVADISADSLEKARKLLNQMGIADRADVSVGDGLLALPRAAQSIAILGMGGYTICGILEKGAHLLQGAALVLSAHTQLHILRKTIQALSYRIDAEEIALAGGRFYVVIRAIPGLEVLDDKACYLGPRLMEKNAPHYSAYLDWRIEKTAQERTSEGAQRLQWLKEERSRVSNSF